MEEIYRKIYIGLAVEPIHIGGRKKRGQESSSISGVACDIDGLPFIPATSLKGCVRAYSSSYYGVNGCDGKGLSCPQPHVCASCSVFGYTNYHHGRDSSSLVRFSSAKILFAPVRFSSGVIWITTRNRLIESGVVASNFDVEFGYGECLSEDKVNGCRSYLSSIGFEEYPTIKISSFPSRAIGMDTSDWKCYGDTKNIYSNSIVVSENLFASCAPLYAGSVSSVSLNPKTGTTKEGALFDIRSINRMSLLYFDILYFNPLLHGISEFINSKNSVENRMKADFKSIDEILNSGLNKIGYYGVGGKRSRGYGRMDVCGSEPILIKKGEPILSSSSKGIRRPEIFISHSWNDKHVARRLAGDLQSEGMDVWLDEHKILVGESIHKKVEEGLRSCDYLILLISSNSLKSSWVNEEINAVRSIEKQEDKVILLPVEIEEIKDEMIPMLLADKKRASMYPKYGDGLQELVTAIRSLVLSKSISTIT